MPRRDPRVVRALVSGKRLAASTRAHTSAAVAQCFGPQSTATQGVCDRVERDVVPVLVPDDLLRRRAVGRGSPSEIIWLRE